VPTQALIDAIVRQTTVLIAQLATAGGARTPLADIADQVFIDIACELHNRLQPLPPRRTRVVVYGGQYVLCHEEHKNEIDEES
jgi:hypothetical protein